MFRVCKISNAKGTKGEPKFKEKLLNFVNLDDNKVNNVIYAIFAKLFLPGKRAFDIHLLFQH